MKFIKTLELTRKVHHLRIAFKLSFQYNKVEIHKNVCGKILSACVPAEAWQPAHRKKHGNP